MSARSWLGAHTWSKAEPLGSHSGWVVGNGETWSDVLAQSFLHGAGEFSLCGVCWRRRGDGVSKLLQGMSRVSI